MSWNIIQVFWEERLLQHFLNILIKINSVNLLLMV